MDQPCPGRGGEPLSEPGAGAAGTAKRVSAQAAKRSYKAIAGSTATITRSRSMVS